MGAALDLFAKHARLCLVAGLLAGFLLPGLAQALRPWLAELVALLLFLTALRVGAGRALGAGAERGQAVARMLVLQVALPVAAALGLGALGWLDHPFALAAVLMLAAPSVTGSPNFTVMLGGDPAPALRLLVLGTAVFPVTVLPVLWLLDLPGLGGAAAGLAAVTLIGVILGAVSMGFAVRAWALPGAGPEVERRLDGASALALAVIVVGLMSAIGPMLAEAPGRLALWLIAVLALNLGLQAAAFAALGRRSAAIPVSIIAGNRNIALFLLVAPEAVMDPLLIFIGCYQVPMYLTPILMRPLYALAREEA